jgi:hypothetical protein
MPSMNARRSTSSRHERLRIDADYGPLDVALYLTYERTP